MQRIVTKNLIACLAIFVLLFTSNVFAACPEYTKTAAGQSHSLFLKSDGTVWASGSNQNGQLGSGTEPSVSPIPLLVTGLTDVIDIDSQVRFSLALLSDGTVWAWGQNSSGQLGNGTFFNSPVPVQVLLPTGSVAVAIAAGFNHALALLDDSTVWAWGSNSSGQLGLSNNSIQLIPVQIPNFFASAIATGDNHSLAIQQSDDAVYAWGLNSSGQLGDGTNVGKNTPTQVSGPFFASAIAAGDNHSLAIQQSDDAVYAWGANLSGQLGDGTNIGKNTPTQVSGPFFASAIAAGGSHSTAIQKSDDAVYAWGSNSSGQLGNLIPVNSFIPVMVNDDDINAASQISAGQFHSLAIRKSDNSPWGWGNNSSGQIGVLPPYPNTNFNAQFLPVPVFTAPQIISSTGTTTICSGSTTFIEVFSNLLGTSFIWKVEQDGVTGGSDFAGSILPQTLSTTSNVPGTATYTVTPDLNGCIGPEYTITVTVNPPPTVTVDPTSQTICSGSFAEIELMSDLPNTTYSWIAAENGVQGAYSATGDIIQQQLRVTKNTPGVAYYTVTPRASGCYGEPVTASVTVDPCMPETPDLFCGKKIKRHGCHYHVLSWNPSNDSSIKDYFIYKGHELIQTVSAEGPYSVTVAYDKQSKGATYSLTSVNMFGTESLPITLHLHCKQTCTKACTTCNDVK